MRTYAAAVAYAKHQMVSPDDYVRAGRFCQKFSRSCVGAQAFGLTARQAFYNIPAVHRHTGPPPPGSIAYYDDTRFNSEAGHAVFVAEDHLVYTTDAPHAGRIGKVHYLWFVKNWGLRYLGYISWTPSGPLPILKPVHTQPVVHVSRVQPGDSNGEVLRVQKALKAEPKIALDYTSGPGVFGPRTVAAYREWQSLLGFERGDADGKPGLTSLKELGKRHGFLAAL